MNSKIKQIIQVTITCIICMSLFSCTECGSSSHSTSAQKVQVNILNCDGSVYKTHYIHSSQIDYIDTGNIWFHSDEGKYKYTGQRVEVVYESNIKKES